MDQRSQTNKLIIFEEENIRVEYLVLKGIFKNNEYERRIIVKLREIFNVPNIVAELK